MGCLGREELIIHNVIKRNCGYLAQRLAYRCRESCTESEGIKVDEWLMRLYHRVIHRVIDASNERPQPAGVFI